MTYDAELKLFIDGNWRSGEGRELHSVINPATASGIADRPAPNAANPRKTLRRFVDGSMEFASPEISVKALSSG